MKDLIYKISIAIILFLCTFFVFKMLQRPAIYDSTLKKVTFTYERDGINKSIIWKVDEPYCNIDHKNTLKWDGGIYYDIREDYYNHGNLRYSFFPLFPLLWKVFPIDALYIGFINYLLFVLSIILFSKYFLKKQDISFLDTICIFVVALILPPIVTFYLPYADALSAFTFALALWGLIKNKYWLFFIFILLFAMTRPIFLVVGLSFFIIDVYYFIKHRNFLHFAKQLALKLFPLLLGTFIVFFMFYLNSGSFTKYFESNNMGWKVAFSIPTKISDWSVEGFGMNVFTIFFILIPSLIIIINKFIKLLRSERTTELPSVFSKDTSFMKEYFLNLSIVYFWGIFLYVIFFQHGSLNGLSRYVIASPFMFIYLFNVIPILKNISSKYASALLIIFLLILSIITLVSFPKIDPAINFNDSGFLTLFLDFIFVFTMKYMNKYVKIGSLSILVFANIIWITYLYNIYLCNGWIFT